MSDPFGTCLLCMDDIDPGGRLATGLQPLVQDVYHLLITERGTLPTDAEFGFGLSDAILSGYGPEELPALADQIETALSEDDRIASNTVEFTVENEAVSIVISVTAATAPPTGFRLVGPLSAVRVELDADISRLNG